MKQWFASLAQAIPRYALTVAGVLALVLFVLLALLPLQIVHAHLSDAAYLKGLLVWAILALLCFVPALSMLIRKIWFFPGRAAPVASSQLREQLLALNRQDLPVRIQESGRALVAQWRYDDPKWCELMDASGIRRMLEMRLIFDETTHTITIRDRFRRVNLELCPVKVRPSLLAVPGVVFSVPPAGTRDSGLFQIRLPVDYTFRPREMKAPLTALILAQGWNVRYTLL